MSILIKNMRIPTSCSVCWALDDYGDYPRCRITEEQRGYNFPIRENRMDNCPLVELPEGHGRLIDSSAIGLTDFEIVMCDGNYKEALTMLLKKIERAPTVIEAEEVGE